MKVFKFGGASVNSPEAVRNMADIVRSYSDDSLVVVVSAMGKTTNKLEQLVPGVRPASEHQGLLQELYNYHIEIINQLFPDAHQDIYTAFNSLFAKLKQQVAQSPTRYNFDYDQTVCFGELMSTMIISHYLKFIGNAAWDSGGRSRDKPR